MLPDPMHPAVVHLPLALAVLMPALAALSMVAIRRQLLPPRIWLSIVLLQGILAGSAWMAHETGEDEEERVEKSVAESHIELHEERAHAFLVLAAVGLLISGGGLLQGSAGRLGRAATLAMSVAVLGGALLAGHSGGELVYRYGAAEAYLNGASAPSGVLRSSSSLGHRHEEGKENEDDESAARR